jgi:acetylornithine deacetylase/succinyl-diaminopimelate desuccinylase-like protein
VAVTAELLDELVEWLRIPSVSAGARDEAALRAAAEWAAERVRAAGGAAELEPTPGGAPLVVGALDAAHGDAPTVLIYGHYDVQDIGDPALWSTAPFEPAVRDGRLYARGASDDKGNFLPLLHDACALARAGELPVHVRVLIEGGEETGDDSVTRWVLADGRGADAAIVFDSGMVDADTPALTLAARGMVFAHLEVRTGRRALHSGVFGGAALNAFHALHAAVAAVLPGENGSVPEPLRAGVQPPAPEELATWSELPDGSAVLAEAGAVGAGAAAGAEFYTRTTADASLDVHRIQGGEPRTIVPEVARADLSLRLAPGQRAPEIAGALEALLRDALPAGAELTFTADLADPASFDPAAPALVAARRALARACGREPALVRTGGSLPVLAAFAERGIPAVVSGFALPDDDIHAPNESYSLRSLDLGRRAARALYEELAGLR